MAESAHPRPLNAYAVCRLGLGLGLLGIAVLSACVPLLARGLLPFPNSRIAAMPWRTAEAVLGVCLVLGLAPRAVWLLTLLFFETSAGVWLYLLLASKNYTVHQASAYAGTWHLCLALGVVALLAFVRPELSQSLRHKRLRTGLLACVTALLVVMAPAFFRPHESAPRPPNVHQEQLTTRYALLEPEEWPDKRFELLDYVDASLRKRLSQGLWAVVLVHHDCPSCAEDIPKYEKWAATRGRQPGYPRVALVEMKPYAPESWRSGVSSCLYGRLSEEKDWIVTAPTVVGLCDGIVKSAYEGKAFAQLILGPRREVVTAKAGPPSTAGAGAGRGGVRLTAGARAALRKPINIAHAEPHANEHSLGLVEYGSAHHVKFQFRNNGESNLQVRRTRSECKCMRVVEPPEGIAPGATAEVTVEFVAPKKSMIYNKRVFVVTTDARRPVVPFRVKARIGQPLELLPRTSDLGTVRRGTERTSQLVLTNIGKRPVRAVYGTSTDPSCFARIPKEAVPSQGKLAIPVVIRAPGRAGSGQEVRIAIHTDCPTQPRLEASFRFRVTDD